MADYNLGTARGRLVIDADGAEQGARKGKKAAEDLGGGMGKLTRASGGLTSASLAIGGAGAAVAGGFAVAVNAASNYEKRLSAIQAVSGASGKEMEALSRLALDLGAKTSFSASEAASAIEELVKAGVSVPDVMNGAAAATVALAEAGELALPEAAAIASNAMNQFNLTADEMPKIADKIAGAANASAIDVKDFGYSLSQAGAVANLAGLDFDDLAIAIAEMGNAGIKGSDAGTSLKTFLSNLQPTTEKQTKLFKKLGLMTEDGTNKFYDSEGSLRSLKDVQDTLSKSLEGMTDQQKQAALETLFGSDAIRAAAVLAESGAKGYDDMSAAMGKMTAADVAAKRMDNLSGSFEELKGSLETIAIQIGQILIPILRQLVSAAQWLLDKWQGLSDGQRKMIVIVGLIVAVFLLLVGAVVGVIAAVAGVAAMFAAAGAALLPVIGIVAAVVAALILLGVAIFAVVKNWSKIKDFFVGVWTAIKDFLIGTFNSIVGGVKGFFASVADFFRNGFDAVIAVFAGFGQKIIGFFTGIWETAKKGLAAFFAAFQEGDVTSDGFIGFMEKIGSGLKQFVDFFKNLWGTISGAVTTAMTAVGNAVSVGMEFVKSILTTALNVLLAPWRAFWGMFGGLFTAVWDLIEAVAALAVRAVTFVIMSQLLLLQAAWNAVWTAVVEFFRSVWDGIVEFVTPIFAAIQAAVVSFVQEVQAIWSRVWSAILGFVIPIITRIRNFIVNGIDAIYTGVRIILNRIKNFWISVWNVIIGFIVPLIGRIRSTITTGVQLLFNAVRDYLNRIKSFWTSVWNAVLAIVRTLWSKIASAVGEKVASVLRVITGIRDKVINTVKSAGRWLYNAGKDIIQGLIDGVTRKIRQFTDLLRNLTNMIPDLKGPPRKDKRLLRPAAHDIMGGFLDQLVKDMGPVFKELSSFTNAIPGSIDGSIAFSTPMAALSPAVSGATYSKIINIDQKNYNPVTKPDSLERDDALQLAAAVGEV